MSNQQLELSLLKFRISVARDRLRDVGTELGILTTIPFYERVDVDDELPFGEAYRKEPLIMFPKIEKKHAALIGLVAVGIIYAVVNHRLNKK